MPLTSITKDAAKLTITVVGDYPVPQKRLPDFAGGKKVERLLEVHRSASNQLVRGARRRR